MIYYSLMFSLLSLYSRGIFEIFFSKNYAYLFEFSLFIFFLFFFILKTKVILKFKINPFILAIFLLIFSIISAFLSFLKFNQIYLLGYILYFLYFSMLFLFAKSITYHNLNRKRLIRTLKIVGLLLLIIALIEQFRIVNMPGNSFFTIFIRPASLTGSYLHYPLVISSIAFTIYSLEKKLSYTNSLFLIAPFLAFSRSGILIIIVSLTLLNIYKLIAFINSQKHKIKQKMLILIPIFMLIIIILTIYYNNFFHYNIHYIYDRITSIINLNEAGNRGRLTAWLNGMDLWVDTNIFFGEYFGIITNFTKNVFNFKSFVVESGLLQLLLNIGLLGCIIFYLIIFTIFKNCKNIYYKSFLIAFIIESLVYQSIEVLPFITSIFLFYTFCNYFSKEISHERFYYNPNIQRRKIFA